jgi:hypothetical protein
VFCTFKHELSPKHPQIFLVFEKYYKKRDKNVRYKTVISKGTSKVVLCASLKHVRSGGTAPRIHNLTTRLKYVITSHLARSTPGKVSCYARDTMVVSPKIRQGRGKCLSPTGKRNTISCSAHILVTIPTELLQLLGLINVRPKLLSLLNVLDF